MVVAGLLLLEETDQADQALVAYCNSSSNFSCIEVWYKIHIYRAKIDIKNPPVSESLRLIHGYISPHLRFPTTLYHQSPPNPLLHMVVSLIHFVGMRRPILATLVNVLAVSVHRGTQLVSQRHPKLREL